MIERNNQLQPLISKDITRNCPFCFFSGINLNAMYLGGKLHSGIFDMKKVPVKREKEPIGERIFAILSE
jgi:hypothetical protein